MELPWVPATLRPTESLQLGGAAARQIATKVPGAQAFNSVWELASQALGTYIKGARV
jgi:hypothetical protein